MDSEGVEPSTQVCKTSVFPLAPTAQTSRLGFEPRLHGFGDQPTTIVFATQWSDQDSNLKSSACRADAMAVTLSLQMLAHSRDSVLWYHLSRHQPAVPEGQAICCLACTNAVVVTVYAELSSSLPATSLSVSRTSSKGPIPLCDTSTNKLGQQASNLQRLG